MVCSCGVVSKGCSELCACNMKRLHSGVNHSVYMHIFVITKIYKNMHIYGMTYGHRDIFGHFAVVLTMWARSGSPQLHS